MRRNIFAALGPGADRAPLLVLDLLRGPAKVCSPLPYRMVLSYSLLHSPCPSTASARRVPAHEYGRGTVVPETARVRRSGSAGAGDVDAEAITRHVPLLRGVLAAHVGDRPCLSDVLFSGLADSLAVHCWLADAWRAGPWPVRARFLSAHRSHWRISDGAAWLEAREHPLDGGTPVRGYQSG